MAYIQKQSWKDIALQGIARKKYCTQLQISKTAKTTKQNERIRAPLNWLRNKKAAEYPKKYSFWEKYFVGGFLWRCEKFEVEKWAGFQCTVKIRWEITTLAFYATESNSWNGHSVMNHCAFCLPSYIKSMSFNVPVSICWNMSRFSRYPFELWTFSIEHSISP